MGRLSTYITILVIMDLMFIITGQLCAGGGTCSFTSVIFSMATNPSLSILSDWVKQFIGSIGDLLTGEASGGTLASLLSTLVAGGVAVGSLVFGLKNDSILFASTGVALSLLVGDFINIYAYLASSSQLVATLIFAPITIIYVFTTLEWVRGMS